MNMKSTAFFSLLPAAAASKGIHLRNTPVVEETTPDVFSSVVELLDLCKDETAALAECYGGEINMLKCAECAWSSVLRDINGGYTDIDDIAAADYQACINDPSSLCNGNCNAQIMNVWSCAKDLYLGSVEEPSVKQDVVSFL